MNEGADIFAEHGIPAGAGQAPSLGGMVVARLRGEACRYWSDRALLLLLLGWGRRRQLRRRRQLLLRLLTLP